MSKGRDPVFLKFSQMCCLGFEGPVGEMLLVVYGAMACLVGVLAGAWEQANSELQVLAYLSDRIACSSLSISFTSH